MKKLSLLFIILSLTCFSSFAKTYKIQDKKGYENIVIENNSNLNVMFVIEGTQKKTVTAKKTTIPARDLFEKGTNLVGQFYKITLDYADISYDLKLLTSEDKNNLVITITASKKQEAEDVDWDFE